MLITNDFELQNELQHELMPEEKLLWSGRPKGGILLRGEDTFLIPFTVLWFGFAIFWETTAISGGAPFFFGLWGIPFILIGFYMAIGRFFYDKINRENTIYGITNNRVIIKSGVFKRDVQSLNIHILFNLSINEKNDGTGTIKLDADNKASPFSFNIPGWPGAPKPTPALEFITEVRSVYNLILKQQHMGYSKPQQVE
jgi:hypothetical protein